MSEPGMMEKNGMLTEESQCDFDPTAKARYYDARSEKVASVAHKDKLVEPVEINQSH